MELLSKTVFPRYLKAESHFREKKTPKVSDATYAVKEITMGPILRGEEHDLHLLFMATVN